LAEVDAKTAALAKAEATLGQALKQAQRTGTLVEKQAASTAQNDIATANFQQAEADVALAKAQLARAKIDLDYATVRASIGGRIGRALVTEGALAQGQSSKLALIQQIDPIYADFSAAASDIAQIANRGSGKEAAEVRLVHEDGELYPDVGRLLFSDASVDPGTGQVSLRAAFPNPKVTLLPGAYVRVRLPEGIPGGAVIVPAQAIQRSSAGEAQAFVVGDDKTVALRPLRTGAMTDAGWIVEEGLKPGEIIIVEGFQKVQPGMAVNASPWHGGPKSASPSSPDAAQASPR
jgi:membrane fusion protein (multidrug efflux system)